MLFFTSGHLVRVHELQCSLVFVKLRTSKAEIQSEVFSPTFLKCKCNMQPSTSTTPATAAEALTKNKAWLYTLVCTLLYCALSDASTLSGAQVSVETHDPFPLQAVNPVYNGIMCKHVT